MNMIPRTAARTVLAAAFALLSCAPSWAQSQGVTKSEILVGTIQDLSGPLAGYAKDVANGLKLRVAEVNEQGGIYGRKIKLLVEDNGYDPKRAVLAAQKLVNQDKIFVMVAHMGSAANLAAMPVLLDKKVMNFLPMSNAREMYEPPNPLKWAFAPPNFESMKWTAPTLYQQKKATKACAMYQDDEFGLEVMRGAEVGLKEIKVELAEKVTYKRGATDFSSQVARLKAAGCDFVVAGTLIRESVGMLTEMRKLAYSPVSVGTTSAYTQLVPELGGKAADGFYAESFALFPYLDDASKPVQFWARKYQTAFGSDPTVFGVYGYAIMDRLVAALQKAGPDLSTATLVKAMESLSVPQDIFGIPQMNYTAARHIGSTNSRISQVQNGRWVVVSDFAKGN